MRAAIISTASRYSIILHAVTLSVVWAGLAPAQTEPASDDPWWPTTGAPAEEAAPPPAAAATPERGNWFLSSPLVNVGWPEIKMPRVSWMPGSGADAPDQPDKSGPIKKMRVAARDAFQRTRTRWNSAMDRMKIGPFSGGEDDGEPGFFAKVFGGAAEERQPETVAGFIAQERPGMK